MRAIVVLADPRLAKAVGVHSVWADVVLEELNVGGLGGMRDQVLMFLISSSDGE